MRSGDAIVLFEWSVLRRTNALPMLCTLRETQGATACPHSPASAAAVVCFLRIPPLMGTESKVNLGAGPLASEFAMP